MNGTTCICCGSPHVDEGELACWNCLHPEIKPLTEEKKEEEAICH